MPLSFLVLTLSLLIGHNVRYKRLLAHGALLALVGLESRMVIAQMEFLGRGEAVRSGGARPRGQRLLRDTVRAHRRPRSPGRHRLVPIEFRGCPPKSVPNSAIATSAFVIGP